MPIDEIVKKELDAYMIYADIMKGNIGYSDPEYKRMINNVMGGNRFGGAQASL